LTRFAPIAPTLISPDAGAWTSSPYPFFDWQSLPLTNQYRILVASDPGFTSLFLDEIAADSEYTSPIAFPFGHFWWTVQGENICGLGASAIPRDVWAPLFTYLPIGLHP
jgi:hypothetical protein